MYSDQSATFGLKGVIVMAEMDTKKVGCRLPTELHQDAQKILNVLGLNWQQWILQKTTELVDKNREVMEKIEELTGETKP